MHEPFGLQLLLNHAAAAAAFGTGFTHAPERAGAAYFFHLLGCVTME